MPQTFHLALLIHAHQPCGNFEHVLEKAYKDSYLPFLEHLEKYPGVHLGLHYSGHLLTWIEKNRPEYFVPSKTWFRAAKLSSSVAASTNQFSFLFLRKISANRSLVSLATSKNTLGRVLWAPGLPSASGSHSFLPFLRRPTLHTR